MCLLQPVSHLATYTVRRDMADNTQVTFSFDDISGVMHQRVKAEFGPDGTATDISYAKPMPSNVSLRTNAIYSASSSIAPVHVLVSASSSSTVTIVAAQAFTSFRVLSYAIVCNATTSVSFGSSVSPITGTMVFDKSGGVAPDMNPYGHFQSTGGQPLTITTGGGAIGGHLTYIPVDYAAEVSITNQTSEHVVATPATATAGYRLNNSGSASKRVAGSYSAISNEWMLRGSVSQYETRATLNSGSTPSGTLGSWLSLSTTRDWELTTASGNITCSLTVEIRRASNGEVLDSATITLTAESS